MVNHKVALQNLIKTLTGKVVKVMDGWTENLMDTYNIQFGRYDICI